MERQRQVSEYGLISRIQKYSLKDGPGIRTTVFLKGCSMNCAWCSNPELVRSTPEIVSKEAICIRCGACYAVCPEEAIQAIDGYFRIQILKCTACGLCVEACPVCARELVGQRMLVDDLVDELMKDQVFYAISGGGVTFSGGEPALQPTFVKHAAQQLRKNQIHVAIDTSGITPWDHFQVFLDWMDLILFDFKFMDSDDHRHYTGVSNEVILSNAKKIADLGIPIIARLIVLPGLNDTDKETEKKISLLQQLDSVIQVDLLPYHKLGVGKYPMLGKVYPLADLEPANQEDLKELKATFQSSGFHVTIGGS